MDVQISIWIQSQDIPPRRNSISSISCMNISFHVFALMQRKARRVCSIRCGRMRGRRDVLKLTLAAIPANVRGPVWVKCKRRKKLSFGRLHCISTPLSGTSIIGASPLVLCISSSLSDVDFEFRQVFSVIAANQNGGHPPD